MNDVAFWMSNHVYCFGVYRLDAFVIIHVAELITFSVFSPHEMLCPFTFSLSRVIPPW